MPRSKRTVSNTTKTKKAETKTTVDQPIVSQTADKEVSSPVGTAEKTEVIRKAMLEDTFSIGELARSVGWPFQKVRRTCMQISRQEGRSLQSVSRGRWVLESSS